MDIINWAANGCLRESTLRGSPALNCISPHWQISRGIAGDETNVFEIIKLFANQIYSWKSIHHLAGCDRNTTVWLVSCHTLSCTVCTYFPVDLPRVHVPRRPLNPARWFQLSGGHQSLSSKVLWKLAAFMKNSDYYDIPETLCPSIAFTCANIHGWIRSVKKKSAVTVCFLFHAILFPYSMDAEWRTAQGDLCYAIHSFFIMTWHPGKIVTEVPNESMKGRW